MNKVYFDESLSTMPKQKRDFLLKKYALQVDEVDFVCSKDKTVFFNSIENEKGFFFVSNLLNLGTSIDEVRMALKRLIDAGFFVVSLDEGFEFGSDETSLNILKGMEIAAYIKKTHKSIAMKSNIQKKREKGQKVGRVLGVKNKKPSLCEVYKDYIIQSLAKGISKTEIAKTVGVTSRTIFNFECQNGLRG